MHYACTCATRARRIRNHANHGTSTYTHVHAFAKRSRACLTAGKSGCIALGMLCMHALVFTASGRGTFTPKRNPSYYRKNPCSGG
eukprot:1973749-Pleurochrysis_carterae.AAC.1